MDKRGPQELTSYLLGWWAAVLNSGALPFNIIPISENILLLKLNIMFQMCIFFFHRFDVGSGMATIRYPTAIKLGEFHTVQLYRNQTQGSLVVDGEAPVNGTSQVHIPLSISLINMLFCGGIMAVKQI